jgi:hypothetical protein
MIEYKGKAYTELNFNECIEFEKELLKKVLAANRAGMGDDLIQQLNVFIDLLRDQKAEAIRKEMKQKGDDKEDGIVLDSDPETLEIIEQPEQEFPRLKKQQVELTKSDKLRIANMYKPARDPEAVKLAQMYKNDK